MGYVSLVSWSLGSVDLGCGGRCAVWAYVWGACPLVSTFTFVIVFVFQHIYCFVLCYLVNH